MSFDTLIILGLALLIFGNRLPEVGRSLGRGIVEFKRGLKGIGDEIEQESSKPVSRTHEALPEGSGAAVEARVSRAERVE
ncbi:MAG: twin-arginine translocase TatA/TatE family subunit [Phycisphaerae bacterium]|nr:twin-arginine translocase TatA/TatE family subunit [Phycisphaerae bacterium]